MHEARILKSGIAHLFCAEIQTAESSGVQQVTALTQRHDPEHSDPHINCREELILGNEV